MSTVESNSYWRSIPGSAKIIMFLEAAVIFFLSFWIFEEFQRNVYLQAYVGGLIDGSLILIVGSMTLIFSALAMVLFLRLHKTRKGLHEILSAEASGLTGSTLGYLDRHMEEHLVEMIRRKNQAENIGTSQTRSRSDQ